MPLVRFQVKNEYGLGDPEVYRTAKNDDSAAILQGVSVAGLVGILRQLGDLAQFAADVFHDLHEQVTATAARSHEMMIQVQHLEAALPPLEQHILAQTSHIHFSYTAGCDWRADAQTDQNHLTRSELPRFILDSYEESRAPPCLYLLDKFDTSGAGACLRRYSDPSFFEMHCASSGQSKEDKARRKKKSHKSKRKERRRRNGEVAGAGSITCHNSRSQYASLDGNGRTDSTVSIHTADQRSNSKQAKESPPFDSITRTCYIEFDVDSSIRPEKEADLSTYLELQYSQTGPSLPSNEQNTKSRENDLPHRPLHGQSSRESSVSWEEKTEIIEPVIEPCGNILEDYGQASDSVPLSFDPAMLEQEASGLEKIDQQDVRFVGNRPEPCSSDTQSDGVLSEPDNYTDAPYTMESEVDSDFEQQNKQTLEIPIAAYGSSNKETSQRDSDSDSVDGSTHAKSSQIPVIPPFAEAGSGVSPDLVEVLKELDFRSLTSGSFVDPDVHAAKNVSDNNTAKSEESPPAKTTGVASVKLWTNGRLFGVEPSKPPDFSTKMGASVPSLECNEFPKTCQDMGQDNRSVNLHSQEFVSAISETNLEKSKFSRPANSLLSETQGIDSTETNVEESPKESVENNFEASELSNMANHDSMELERSCHFEHSKHSVASKEKLDLGSPRTSAYPKSRYIEHSSPPLEHMKILFDPINMESSELKLEFSNGDHLHESIEDALFPSFHLLPRPQIPLGDIGSETDDDTFYRLSSSLSMDLLSQDSELNSEQWETRSNDEIHGQLYRVSSATSISSSLEPEVNWMPPPQSPPPLPPLQWRIMMPPVTLIEVEQNIIPDSVNQPIDPQVLGSVDNEQTKLAAPGKIQKEAVTVNENNTPKLLGEPNQPAIGKKTDERELLLEQIRTKSFSLRSTITARPNLMPSPTANTNVAIFEKANAIRQAFTGNGEGDDDDDKWSNC